MLRCFRCGGDLHDYQQEYMGMYYLVHICATCGKHYFSTRKLPSAVPWAEIPITTEISEKTMKGLAKLFGMSEPNEESSV